MGITTHTPDQSREQIEIGQPKCKCGGSFLVYRVTAVRKKRFLGITATCTNGKCENSLSFIADSEAEMLAILMMESNQTGDNMTPDEKLKADQSAIPTAELLEIARSYIRNVTLWGAREWRTSIPVNKNDADMIFQEICRRLENQELLITALENLLDEQNDAPLERRRAQWETAIFDARAAIDAAKEVQI